MRMQQIKKPKELNTAILGQAVNTCIVWIDLPNLNGMCCNLHDQFRDLGKLRKGFSESCFQGYLILWDILLICIT